MRVSTKLALAIAATALFLSACARQEPRPVPPRPPVIVQPPAPSPASVEDYFKQEASRSLLIVRAADLALQRSTSSRTRRIAGRLKADHNGIAAQLSMAGRRLNLLPAASLPSADRALLDGLTRTADFDSAYSRIMKSAVENCRRSHDNYARHGSSPTLRPVARFAASTCEDEMRLF